MTVLEKHPEKNLIRLQLRQNVVLKTLDSASMVDIALLVLLRRGSRECRLKNGQNF